MAEAIKDRNSVRRVSEMISQIHTCSPIGTTIRNFSKSVTTSPAAEPPASGRKRKSFHFSESIELDIYLDYYTGGKEFYEKLEERCECLQAYPGQILSRIENIVNNTNNVDDLKIDTFPGKYKQTLSLRPAATLDTSARLLADIQERIQSDFARKQLLFHTSEDCVATVSDLRTELCNLSQYMESVNNILTPHADPMFLFRQFTRLPD